MSDEEILLIGLGIWLIASKWFEGSPAQALQQGGSRLYDLVHDDSGHKQDLPGHQWTKQAVEALAQRHRFPDPHLAMAIAMAESGGVPGALLITNREESVGLWQINIKAHPQYTRQQMKDPEQNAMAAYKISKGGTDWRPWSVYKNNTYQRFL